MRAILRRPGGPLGLGIVGCGGAALEVVRATTASRSVRIVAVHDHDRGRMADFGARAGATAHATLRGLLADAEVDAVYVALPHDSLARTAATVLDAGRHVLVEKPLATTLAGLARVRAAADAGRRSVGVMFELRHGSAAERCGDLVRAGAIGAPRMIRIRTLIDKPAEYWRSGPTGRVEDGWRGLRRRAGGGVALMNSVHQLDLVRAITGLEVDRVSAETRAGVPGVEVEDVAVAALRFAGGALGSLAASAHSPGAIHGETIEIDGTHGAIRLPDPYDAGQPPLLLLVRRPWGAHVPDVWHELHGPPVDPWSAALESFAAAIAGGRPPDPGLDDAEAALATVLAMYRSAATGRSVAVRRSFDSP